MKVRVNFTMDESVKDNFFKLVERDPESINSSHCIRNLIENYIILTSEKVRIFQETVKQSIDNCSVGDEVGSKDLLAPILSDYPTIPNHLWLFQQLKKDVDDEIFPNLIYIGTDPNGHALYKIVSFLE